MTKAFPCRCSRWEQFLALLTVSLKSNQPGSKCSSAWDRNSIGLYSQRIIEISSLRCWDGHQHVKMLSRMNFARHLRIDPFVLGFPATVLESGYITCKRVKNWLEMKQPNGNRSVIRINRLSSIWSGRVSSSGATRLPGIAAWGLWRDRNLPVLCWQLLDHPFIFMLTYDSYDEFIYVKARWSEAFRASYWEMQVNNQEGVRNWL